jgi:hypothetical protein
VARNIPIITSYGILSGRDCVYLDKLSFENGTSTLLLEGSITGNLCDVPQDGDLTYSLRFRGVLALNLIELDSWNWKSASCFDEVRESDWISSLGGKVTLDHRHFFLQTYDDVFQVVCSSYELQISQ